MILLTNYSIKLVKEFDVIAIKYLNMLGISKGILSKQVYGVAWSSFYQKLTYKAENADKKLIKVNPNSTSQMCICGARVEKTLTQRKHICLKCGYSNHRDIVSAKVILENAIRQTVETLLYDISHSVVLESPL